MLLDIPEANTSDTKVLYTSESEVSRQKEAFFIAASVPSRTTENGDWLRSAAKVPVPVFGPPRDEAIEIAPFPAWGVKGSGTFFVAVSARQDVSA